MFSIKIKLKINFLHLISKSYNLREFIIDIEIGEGWVV